MSLVISYVTRFCDPSLHRFDRIAVWRPDRQTGGHTDAFAIAKTEQQATCAWTVGLRLHSLQLQGYNALHR